MHEKWLRRRQGGGPGIRGAHTLTMSYFAVPSGRFWILSTYPAEDAVLDIAAAAEPGTALLTAYPAPTSAAGSRLG